MEKTWLVVCKLTKEYVVLTAKSREEAGQKVMAMPDVKAKDISLWTIWEYTPCIR